jgi:hypothetical protein
VLVVLVVFHRPLLRTALDAGLRRAAAKEHLLLTFDIGGPVLNGLVLKNVRGKSDGPGHFNKIEADEIRLNYNLLSLFKNGPDGFLKNCEIRNASIEITPVLAGEHPPKKGPGMVLHDFMRPPAVISNRYRIENLNLVSHTPDGDFILQSASALLDPDTEGFVRIEKLQIPNLHTWNKIDARVNYKNRNLSAQNLAVDDQMYVTSLALEPNPGKNKPYRIAVQAQAFGGTAIATLSGNGNDEKIKTANLSATLKEVSLNQGFAYFGRPIPAEGCIRDFSMELAGNPDVPATWIGTASGRIESGAIVGVKFEGITAKIDALDGTAHVEGEVTNGGNSLRITAATPLPKRAVDLAGNVVKGDLQFTAGEPGRFISRLTHGAGSGSGSFSVSADNFSAKIKATAKEFGGGNFSIARAGLSLDCAKSLAKKDRGGPFFNTLQTSIDADFSGFTAGGCALDSGSISLTSNNSHATVAALGLKRAQGVASAHGEFDLPPNPDDWRAVPFKAEFSVSAPELGEIYSDPVPSGMRGQFNAHGTLEQKEGELGGHLSLTGTHLGFAEFSADKLNLEVPVEKNIAVIQSFELGLNATDGATGTGKIALRKPFAYDGKLVATIRDLAVFNPLLRAMGFDEPVAGSLAIDWQGGGNPALMQHSGTGSVKLQKGRLGGLQPLEIGIAGNYSPESIDFPTFHVEAGTSWLDAVVRLRDANLDLHEIKYRLNQVEVATGKISFPLNLREGGDKSARLFSVVPTDGKVSADLVMKELPVESLVPGRKLPVKGTVAGTFTAQGSLDRLEAGLQIQGRNLQSGSMPKLAPSALDLALLLRDNRLALSGTLKQQEITPLQISGDIPFPVVQIIREKKIDDQSPVRLSVKLPKTSVAFLARLIPDLRFADGQASLDAGVTGTIAKPEMHGAAIFDLAAVRFQKPDWPAINGFKGDLVFSGDRLTVNRFGGEISGGSFNLGGRVQFVKLTEPVLDLRFISQGALVARNETLTIRADSDIKISGPLNKADVTGSVGLTKSRFFREIELLPIQLPGRPAPKPPETTHGFSFKNPPLRDWKFNVAIRTKDPFVIRGNLTNGAATVDLKLLGTGFAPTLDGSIRIENFTASLPFSSLDVSYGFIYFNPRNPFVPTLDLQATSSLRDYNISANIYGDASNPQTILSSEPPLPQEEILALLATGATTQDLTGNSDVLAGRAAVLVFQQFYYKIFKRQEASGNETFLNRFQLDVGGVDPRTGKQEIGARFRIGEKFYLIGSVDVQGDVRGQVKYLLQFR